MAKTLHQTIIAALPELENSEAFHKGVITLRNDSDGVGDYIEKWEYSEPIPDVLKLGKPKK